MIRNGLIPRLALLLWGGLGGTLGADGGNALVREISGKVEVRRGEEWQTLARGENLSSGDKISTGFDSKAVLVLQDGSVLVVYPLTRLTLAELTEKQGGLVTDLYLDVGNVRGQVNSSESSSHDFTVRNAASTASVRGTVLDVEVLGDGSGMKVMAWEGMALVRNNRTGRTAEVGEKKKEEKRQASGKEESGEPSEPPAAILAAPVLTAADGGMITSAASARASASVTVSTEPPSPENISLGGGSSLSTEVVIPITDSGGEIPEAAPSGDSTVTLNVTWP